MLASSVYADYPRLTGKALARGSPGVTSCKWTVTIFVLSSLRSTPAIPEASIRLVRCEKPNCGSNLVECCNMTGHLASRPQVLSISHRRQLHSPRFQYPLNGVDHARREIHFANDIEDWDRLFTLEFRNPGVTQKVELPAGHSIEVS